jgi:hypothetical protein
MTTVSATPTGPIAERPRFDCRNAYTAERPRFDCRNAYVEVLADLAKSDHRIVGVRHRWTADLRFRRHALLASRRRG